ncbi:PaaI family thioesterase [Microbacterium lemovicicum]|uniref:PaaI family thioesterase n=1 Tax=Microbacterium lemovicicum TaxID=1072463 RepID=UPI001F494DE8|nr:PaaI family thioesterase [Microbacterium lemovicicum]
MTDPRSRTFDWADPVDALRQTRTAGSGLEALRAMIAGSIPPPPIAQLMGFTLVQAEPGLAVFECQPAEFHYNPIGAVHGGLACTLLDSALGCAGHTTLPAGVGYTSVDLSVRYLRPITHASGILRATGRVLKPGRRVIFTEGELTDAAGRVVAAATSSLLVLSPTD